MVSVETAKKLKGVGFPQPKPSLGQVWLDTDGAPFLITAHIDRRDPFTCTPIIDYTVGSWYESVNDFQYFTYMPMIADLFTYLPFALWRNQVEKGYEWVAYSDQADTPDGFVHSTNPAEALALLWLANHS